MLNLCLQNIKGISYQNGIDFQHLSCICLSACCPCYKWLCLWIQLCTVGSDWELKVPPRLYQNQHHCCFLSETNQNSFYTNGRLYCLTIGDSGKTGNKLLHFILETGYRPQNTHGLLFCPKTFLDSFTGKKTHSVFCEIQELSLKW